MNRLLAAALDYAARGWLVAPLHTWTDAGCSCGTECASPAKHPRTRNGLKDASRNPQQIRLWWERQWPDANIAIVTGAVSGLVVVDSDGDEGADSLWDLERAQGALPETVQALTGGGGRHLLFRHPGEGVRVGNKQRLAPGLDIRGDGGYIVAPPSLHRSGRRYEWDAEYHPEDAAFADLPDWLLSVLTGKRTTPVAEWQGDGDHVPARVEPIRQGCGWFRHCITDAKTLGEAAWYGFLTITGRCEDGEKLAHGWSRPHPGYSPEETTAKLRHARLDTGPYSCARIREDLGGEPHCSGCVHWGRVRSPISLARTRFAEMEVPPEAPVSVGMVDDWMPEDEPEPEPAARPAATQATQRQVAPEVEASAPATEDVPPHSFAAEQATLGGLLSTGNLLVVRRVLETLSPPEFYDPRHDLIFGAMRDLVEASRPVDVVTVAEALRDASRLDTAGGESYLRQLVQNCPREESVEAYAATVARKARLRLLIGLVRETETDCRAPSADPVKIEEQLTHFILGMRQPSAQEAVCYADALEQELDRIERGETEPVLRFGIEQLDRITGGLGRGEVGIICGRPGYGKSVWCAMQLRAAAKDWGPVLYVSLEMGASELVRRDLAGLTELGYRDLLEARKWDDRAGRSRDLTYHEKQTLQQARAELREVATRIWIDEHASSLSKLIHRVHRYRLQHRIEALILDYGQLVRDDTGGRSMGKAEEVMRVARALKTEIAVPLRIPVWVAVQANRESEKGEKPKMLTFSDLGWSGEWEAVAGRILFLNPDTRRMGFDTPDKRHVLLDVHKNRHGGRGCVSLTLHGPRFRFAPTADAEPEEGQWPPQLVTHEREGRYGGG